MTASTDATDSTGSTGPTESSERTLVAPGLRVGTRDGGRIETWAIDNPERKNAITPDALRWMAHRASELSGQVVILRAHAGSFCSGFDLQALRNALASGDETLARAPDRPLMDATEAMQAADASFIAVIHGYVIGAGVELCAACDFRFFADDAWLMIPAAKLGVVYHAEGLRRIRAAFGPQIVRRLVLGAQRVPATELGSTRGATALVSSAELDAHAHSFATELGTLDANASRHNRRLLRALDELELNPAMLEAHERARTAAYARVRSGDRDED